jgi:hypothetical protein
MFLSLDSGRGDPVKIEGKLRLDDILGELEFANSSVHLLDSLSTELLVADQQTTQRDGSMRITLTLNSRLVSDLEEWRDKMRERDR